MSMFSSKGTSRGLLFSNRDLYALFLPAIAEQGLEFLIGLIDSLMAAQISESAVSGISLVDFVMAFMISLFAALAAGGAVIVGQYLGSSQEERAHDSARQLMKAALFGGILAALFLYGVRHFILRVLFGEIAEDVYVDACMYYTFMLWSIPFLALYNAGAGLFRTAGRAKFPMKVMLYANILHIFGNGYCLFVLDMGVEGIAIPSLMARVGAAIFLLAAAFRPSFPYPIRQFFTCPADFTLIRQILTIGVPFGLENGMFYFGRIIVLSIVALFGTASIAANAVAGTIATFIALPGMAIIIALPVVISRCAGAGDIQQIQYYTKKISFWIQGACAVSSVIVLSSLPFLLELYHLSPEAERLTWIILISIAIGHSTIWSAGYMLPVVFRSAGDSKFPMYVSMASMVFCRIVMAYVFAVHFHMGMLGTWAAMYLDWIIKGAIYVHHYVKQHWVGHQVIDT